MSVITGLTVRAVRVPMPVPHRTARGVITESPLVLIDITTSDGVVGHGIVFTYTAAALKPTANLVQNLEPLLKSQPLAPTQLESDLAARFRLLGTKGLVGMALAGIDMALWDALARTHQTSLIRLLGGVEKPVRAYAAIGFDGPLESAKAAEEWATQGFQGVKAKIGYPDAKQDLETIRAIRHAVGDTVAVMVDYNQSLTPTEAIERLRLLDDEGLTWIEEPTLAYDYAGHAAIAREIRTPIQCGENWWGALDLRHAIEARASDYVMPEVMKMGGVTGWLRAVSVAETHGLRVSTHLWPEISAQLLCTTPMAHWLEYAEWWNSIIAEPLRIHLEMASIEDVAGSGVEWNEAAVTRYLA